MKSIENGRVVPEWMIVTTHFFRHRNLVIDSYRIECSLNSTVNQGEFFLLFISILLY